ncbi:MAG: serine hydrolase domain-containing protein [Bacteroidota bacterium]
MSEQRNGMERGIRWRHPVWWGALLFVAVLVSCRAEPDSVGQRNDMGRGSQTGPPESQLPTARFEEEASAPTVLDQEWSGPAPVCTLPDRETFQERVRLIAETAPVNSILIRHQGETIVEQYIGSMDAGSYHNIKSASKSLLSLWVGIAIEQGYLESVDEPIAPWFPEYFESNSDSPKAEITIRDLLTMQTGLASTSGRNYGTWVTSRDWVRHALERPLTGTPGVDRVYSTGTTHLLGVILARASDMPLRTFAERHFFDLLGIPVGGWDRDPQGNNMGGNNLALRPSDLLTIGELVMHLGEHEGEQLVPADWIRESIQPYSGRGSVNDYGYLWFRRMAGPWHEIYAWGNGGQFLKIYPELETVVAITSREGGGARREDRFHLFDRIDEELLPCLSAPFGEVRPSGDPLF